MERSNFAFCNAKTDNSKMEEIILRQYVVDAFTEKVFAGNPAAVCIKEKWLSDELMFNIAKENNLSETAFAVKEGSNYKLRWFTPGGEVDLCGHATLATAYVINKFYEPHLSEICFDTKSGLLKVIKAGEFFKIDFPAYELQKVAITTEIVDALGTKPLEAYLGRDLLCILESEIAVKNLNPDQEKLKRLAGLLLQVSAKGSHYDCVSRTFAPKMNIPEDPVCGSGHCHIIPFWAQRLNKDKIVAYQASARGGTLYGEHKGQRVIISGKAALFSIAELYF